MTTAKTAAKKRSNKKAATKTTIAQLSCTSDRWNIFFGELKRGVGRPEATEHLFQVLGEKLPFECLSAVRRHLNEQGYKAQGVYVAHDSMGCPRYIGRGKIFHRLEARKKAQPLELEYFSFYLVSEKKHEREIETLLIRTAGFLLEFNDKKKRVGLQAGNLLDYEAGTVFYERRYQRGKRT